MKKYIVTLTKDERETLRALTSKGKHKSQKILNALILLGCDAGEYQIKHSTNEEIARILDEHHSGPAPTRTTTDPSSTDQPPSQGSPGFGVAGALLGIALVVIARRD